jgi:exosortase
MSQAINNVNRTRNSLDNFQREFGEAWRAMPNKCLFFVLLGGWVLLFALLGNPTMGYFKTPSLFGWLYGAYTRPGSEDEHGLLIPFIVLGLLWWKRRALLEIEKQVWLPGLIPFALAAALHVVGYLIQQPRLSAAGLFGGLYALIAVVWGWRFARACFFPMVLLVFSMPLGDVIEPVTIPLRMISTKAALFVVRDLLGIQVLAEGVMIMDPKGTYQYEVAAPCSGIHSFIAMLALTTIYGFITFRTNWRRGLIAFLALPLALMGNVLRLVCIIVAAEAFGREAGEFVHNWFGFATFLMALFVMFVVGGWLREPDVDGTMAGTAKAV